MIGEDGTGWGKTVLAPIVETVPMFWFCVNMGAWLVMGLTLYRYMQRLGDMADDVLLMQLKPQQGVIIDFSKAILQPCLLNKKTSWSLE